METAGLKWAPEIGPNVRINAASAAAVAMVFASSAIAPFPPDSRSAMMPDPTTAARSIAVPINSAANRRGTSTVIGAASAWRSWLRLLRARRTARATGGAVEHIQLSERPLKLLPVLSGGWQLLQGIHRGRDNAPHHGTERPRHLVVHPHAVAPGGHQPALAQVREMAGDSRLWQPKAVVDVADAYLVVPKKSEDAQTGLVGECLEHVLQLVDGRPGFGGRCALHIFVLTNLSRVTYIRQHEYLRSKANGRNSRSGSAEIRRGGTAGEEWRTGRMRVRNILLWNGSDHVESL